MSGMPNKASPFTETTKMLHSFCLLLCSIFTYSYPIVLLLFYYMFLIGCSYFWLSPIVVLLS